MKSSQKKIRILECIRQGKIGGGETHVLDLVAGLDRAKFEPIVLSFTDGSMVDNLKSMGVKTEVVHTEQGFDVSKWNRVKAIIKREKIDIVHAHGTRACSNVFWAAKSLGIPLVYTIHGWSFHQDQNWVVYKCREWSEHLLTNQANLNINVSYSNQNDGIKHFNIKRSVVINYGINRKKFDVFKKYKNICAEIGIPSGKTVVGFIVRITVQKDPITLIKAFRQVIDKTKDVILLVVGNGDLREEVIHLVKKLDLSQYVVFQDFRQDVPELLSSIDIYCLPSLWEGLPIGLLEAMTMRKAIVATPVDGTKEAIIDGENGLLIPHQNPEKLADALLRLHFDKNLRENIAENAYQTVLKTYGLERMVKEVEREYLKLIPNPA